jgi:uncharacterized protein YbjT (DUF2867 family)
LQAGWRDQTPLNSFYLSIMKTAIVIGATGLVGTELVTQLLADDRFSKVKVFARRSVGISNEKLEEHIINFDAVGEWSHLVAGDVLFSALGTTIKQAGSQDAQYKIDHNYQYNFAKAAATNGVKHYVLISSAYASPGSRIFYSRMKGELERDIQQLSFEKISIIRPGLLAGDRKEFRLGERISQMILPVLKFIPGLQGYTPIHARKVAKAMINAVIYQTEALRIYELKEVFQLAEK